MVKAGHILNTCMRALPLSFTHSHTRSLIHSLCRPISQSFTLTIYLDILYNSQNRPQAQSHICIIYVPPLSLALCICLFVSLCLCIPVSAALSFSLWSRSCNRLGVRISYKTIILFFSKCSIQGQTDLQLRFRTYHTVVHLCHTKTEVLLSSTVLTGISSLFLAQTTHLSEYLQHTIDEYIVSFAYVLELYRYSRWNS